MSDVTPQSVASKSGSTKSSPPAGVRNPDSLQETLLGIGSWLEKNAALVLGLFVFVLVIGAGFVAWNWWSNRVELKAQTAYYTLEAKYTKLKDEYDRAKFAEMMPNAANQNTEPKAQAATGDLNKDYGTIPGELESFARENSSTSAGAQAAILAANLYLNYQQPDKAAEIAKISATNLSDNRLLTNLAKMVWGSALADKGDCGEAVKVWQQIIDNKNMSTLHADASLRAGLCYETLNEPGKAREFYQKVTAQSDDSSAATTAKGLLRALEAKSPTTPSSNTPSSANAGNS